METKDLVWYSGWLCAAIISWWHIAEILVYYLDWDILNRNFGLDKKREILADKLKLSLAIYKDREKVNLLIVKEKCFVLFYSLWVIVILYNVIIIILEKL